MSIKMSEILGDFNTNILGLMAFTANGPTATRTPLTIALLVSILEVIEGVLSAERLGSGL